ncbi:relaxase/mobilization nuclease domain-containing protein [Rubrivirga litoralis]|uniref:Relaxase/mobilization nuclease domain-containing protein n=1 Tax=Rubrivirga litoralis TaxID=3075598 RepID=A0ABU3BUH0_9BACT|nr:relaxase/mobilization nuclease domain-containing protein [Rubrivirga sp. F394]MDT0632942.1 relaxase/mobilization nuclease domain-containing protein [Rubrivirga sp. F394]
MIGASNVGGSFRALGGYLVQKDEGRVGWVETRNLEGRDVDQVVTEMEEWAGQSARVKRPVYHVIVAFDADDRPTEAEMRSAADRTLRDLGLQDHQALIVRHTDRAHEHVHLMVNRVGPDGKAWSKENDHYKIRASMESQERELGVRWTGWNAERVARVERAAERSDEGSELRHFYGGEAAREPVPVRGVARDRGFAAEVRASSLDDLKGASSWADLDARLAARGLTIERRGQGAVVTDGEREAKLSSVSRSVSRGRLEARLGPLRDYDRAAPGRAAPTLSARERADSAPPVEASPRERRPWYEGMDEHTRAVNFHIGGHLRRATSWADLERRIGRSGYHIERAGTDLVVSKEGRASDAGRPPRTSTSRFGAPAADLERRLGPFDAHDQWRKAAWAAGDPAALVLPSAARGRAAAEGAPSRAPRAPASLLSRRRAAAALGKVGRRLQPVSVRGAVGRAIRGGAEQDPETRVAQKAARLTLGVARASLAGRRAAATGAPAQRDAPPGRAQRTTQGRLRGLVRARETARVERVVALVGRAHGYERAATALGAVSRYKGRVDGAVGLARQASEKTQALDVHLGRIYERPAEARARMLGYAEKAGPEKVSELLAREPEKFGKMVAPPSAGGRPETPTQSRLGKLFSKPAAVPDHAANVARRVQETGPLVASAHQARSSATEAVRALGLRSGAVGQINGRELSEAVERRAGRLRGAVDRGLGRVPGTRAASAELARAVRGLTPSQQARVASRIGKTGLGTVSRSVSAAKALVRGLER